jgi:hypothetical protein
MTITNSSHPTFLQVAMSPHRHGEPERYITINIRAIQQVEPPCYSRAISTATGKTTTSLPDPRYSVSFKFYNAPQQFGSATADDLKAAGIPLPPMEQW